MDCRVMLITYDIDLIDGYFIALFQVFNLLNINF